MEILLSISAVALPAGKPGYLMDRLSRLRASAASIGKAPSATNAFLKTRYSRSLACFLDPARSAVLLTA